VVLTLLRPLRRLLCGQLSAVSARSPRFREALGVLLLSGLVSREKDNGDSGTHSAVGYGRSNNDKSFKKRRVPGFESRCHLYDAGESQTGTAVPLYDDTWGETITVAGL
jgi:hypothetical protein